MIYQCECGRQYDNPQAYNGHKSHCIIHMQCNGKYDKFLEDDYNRHENLRKTVTNQVKERQLIKSQQQQEELEQWISEYHKCEKCGKVMTEKYGSGRFCSINCQNSHIVSEDLRNRISSSVRQHKQIATQQLKQQKIENYYSNPSFCVVCNTQLPYEFKDRKTCSQDCLKKLISIKNKDSVHKHNGNHNTRTRGHSKYGTYKGFHCDSSWELAIVVYCKEHNIQIERNNTGFPYTYENNLSMYYPDFIIDGIYTEIKNYWTEQVQAKIDCFPKNLKYQIWYYDDIKHMLDYVQSTYGKDFCSILYDRSYPSYMDKLL